MESDGEVYSEGGTGHILSLRVQIRRRDLADIKVFEVERRKHWEKGECNYL